MECGYIELLRNQNHFNSHWKFLCNPNISYNSLVYVFPQEFVVMKNTLAKLDVGHRALWKTSTYTLAKLDAGHRAL